MLTGTATVDELLGHAATMTAFDTDAVSLPDSHVLQATFEIRIAGRCASLPSGLHPTNPPTFVAQVWRCPSSPWGPFLFAQGRLGARSGLRPRSFVQSAVCDNPVAADALAQRWGFPVRRGTITFPRYYDLVETTVAIDGELGLALHLNHPVPLGGDDVSYPTTVTLAHTPRGPRLVQVEADVAVQRAERLTPALVHYDGRVLGLHPSVEPYHPVSASVTTGTITLAPLRFVGRPDELAFTGTETI
jgi:hypothetical protein